jgi:raffinose/stachyose/melibiose transport system permease protein
MSSKINLQTSDESDARFILHFNHIVAFALKNLKVISPHLLFVSLAIINIFPIIFITISAFKTNMDFIQNPIGLPIEWTIDSFRELIYQRPFPRQMANSIIVSGSTLAISTALAIPAAYAFSRLRFRARNILFDCTTALMGIPLVVTIVPLFALMSKLHLINRFPSAITVYVGFTLPFSIYVLAGFFQSIPGELIDAAKVDGAEHLQIIRHIIMPLAKAPIITLCIINGLWVWNELLVALLFLQSETSTTLMASIARGISRDVRNIPIIMAGCAIASIPSMLFVFFGQRYFVRGFLGGSSR